MQDTVLRGHGDNDMEVKYTNFEGDWNALCEYCGKSNLSHQVNAGAFDEITYIHRQPCDEQLQHSKKCAPARGLMPRLLQRIQGRRPAPQAPTSTPSQRKNA